MILKMVKFCTFLNLFTSMMVSGALYIFVPDLTTYGIINLKKDNRHWIRKTNISDNY